MSNQNIEVDIINRLTSVINILENNIEVKGMYCGNLYGVIAILKDTIDLIQKETQQFKGVELSDAPQE
jgi:hypothetical protein